MKNLTPVREGREKKEKRKRGKRKVPASKKNRYFQPRPGSRITKKKGQTPSTGTLARKKTSSKTKGRKRPSAFCIRKSKVFLHSFSVTTAEPAARAVKKQRAKGRGNEGCPSQSPARPARARTMRIPEVSADTAVHEGGKKAGGKKKPGSSLQAHITPKIGESDRVFIFQSHRGGRG